MRITYRSDNGRRMSFVWPQSNEADDGVSRQLLVHTLEDRPDPPGRPRFLGADSNLTWEPRPSNSADVVTYELQAR